MLEKDQIKAIRCLVDDRRENQFKMLYPLYVDLVNKLIELLKLEGDVLSVEWASKIINSTLNKSN